MGYRLLADQLSANGWLTATRPLSLIHFVAGPIVTCYFARVIGRKKPKQTEGATKSTGS
jgi:hypothetical protein